MADQLDRNYIGEVITRPLIKVCLKALIPAVRMANTIPFVTMGQYSAILSVFSLGEPFLFFP